jgi:redox-sensitive bicupin YhaK (pirin superfamily)
MTETETEAATMEEPTVERAIGAVSDRQRLGADEQVDDKALVLAPGNWKVFDPFLMLSEDWFSAVGFEWHPHRGIETVTVVLDGELEHGDNHGGRGVLGAGDVQWMTAGKGIIHRELAHGRRPVHTLQLWLNLPADRKLTDVRYQDLRGGEMPVRRQPGAVARVYSGRSGDVLGPAANHVPVTMLDVRVDPGASFTHEVPAVDNGFVYVIEGRGRFGQGRTPVSATQVGHLAASDAAGGSGGSARLVARADGEKQPLRFLYWSGPPLREPVVAYGPFVMNSPEQIAQAFADYRAGKFGPIPG